MTNDTAVRLVQLTTIEAGARCEPLFIEYGEWSTRLMRTGYGISVDPGPFHAAFREELPQLLGERTGSIARSASWTSTSFLAARRRRRRSSG